MLLKEKDLTRMSMKIMEKAFLINLILSMTLLSLQENQANVNTSHIQEVSYSINDVIPIEYFNITITNDANFTDYGFPGTGTKENPFRIENYSIVDKTYERALLL